MNATRLDAPPRMYNRLFWLNWISYYWALGFALWTMWLIVQTVLNCLPGAHVLLDVPITVTYPPHPGALSYSGSAYVVPHTSVTFTRASMLVSHLSISHAVPLGLGQIFASATSSGIAWCTWVLVRKLRANEPFTQSTSRALVIAGLILGIGSTASAIATAIGQLALNVAYIPKYGDWPQAVNDSQFIPFTPLFFAGVLFALAAVFRYGAQLEGERAELKRETEGLV
jgi:Protein of unknown function (DUF2975)